MIHHAQLQIAAEQQRDTVDETGVTNDGDHCVNGHQTGNETRDQVQVTDQSCGGGLHEAQIQRQQICHNNGNHNGGYAHKQREEDVLQLVGIREEIHVVVKGKTACLRVGEALLDGGNDRPGDNQHNYQECRDDQSIAERQSFLFFTHNSINLGYRNFLERGNQSFPARRVRD